MAIPSDEEMVGELEAMYDQARNQNRGETQALILIAIETHKQRVIAETMAPQEFEWPIGENA